MAENTAKSWLKPSLDWMLIFVPIAIAMRFIPSLENPTALFIVSCLAIIPLAGWMGKATEHLAEHMGQGVGGLLNATFGNAAELIIALFASGQSDAHPSNAHDPLGKSAVVAEVWWRHDWPRRHDSRRTG